MKTEKRILLNAFLLVVILASALWFTPLKAQEPKPPQDNPPPYKTPQFNGTYIAWKKEENTSKENWSWRNQAWEFGPYPTFSIYLQNGTEVTDTSYIPLGAPFKTIIYVQKNIFTGNATLGRAGLQWNTEIRSQNGTITGNANLRMVHINKMQTNFWNETNAWHIESFVFNGTEGKLPMGSGPQPPPPPEQMKQFSFYNFDKNSSKVTETSEAWQIEFVGSFNTTTTPKGPYWVNLEVTDQYDSWIDFGGYRAWFGKQMATNRMIAVGKPGFTYGGFQDTWTFEKLDMENQLLYSAAKGSPWKMRINVTGSELANVTIGMELGWNAKTYVNVTGWYPKTVTTQGGWMYNETSAKYYWNSTVQVTRTEQVFGPHPEERWINVNHNRQINITRQYWDPITQESKFTNETIWTNEKMFLIYDHASHSFSVKQGYSYWSYDPELHRDRDFTVFYDLNASDPTTRVYNLSLTDSNWSQTGPNAYTIEFVGVFSNQTFADRDEYWFQIMVYTGYGQIWANWENTNPGDFQIAVDKTVAISSILDSRGRQVKGWMFQTDRDESFIVQSKLYGAGVKYKDLDGIGVVFRTSQGRWGANESYWSDVEIRLVKDLSSNTLNTVTYNRTNKNAYVYGLHKGWALINVTDWHTEYNSTSGTWDWVESPQLRWNETTITDWHWENFRLNQTEYARDPNSPKIWMDTQRTWVSDLDPAFAVPQSYARLNSANMSLQKGVVTVNMNISFTSSAPESNYWWNMLFQNMTFGRDWTQGWGEHIVTEWTSEPVYFANGSATNYQAWYVSKPSTPLYTMYSGQKYLLEQLPYTTIGGVDYPIRVRTQYDSWRQEEFKQYLFTDPYDPSLGTQPRYYELLNGTKILVQEAFQAVIRKITLNTTDAYLMIGNTQVPVANGAVFNTYMDRAREDWSKRFWDPILQRDIVPFYYEFLNGSRIYRNEGFETQVYNMTTYRWNLAGKRYAENVTALLVESVGSGVTLNQTVVLLREPGWWQTSPDGSGYFLVMKNGTRITIKDPWSVPDDQRIVVLNGLKYLIGWPAQYYKGTFNGESLTIRGGGMEGYVRNFYYTDLGVKDGVKHEIPYPGAMATSWWELEGIESEGRKLRTTKSVTIDGSKYVLYQRTDGSYYIIVDGVQESVPPPTMDFGYYYSSINGQEHWDVAQDGFVLRYGEYSEKSGQFTAEGSLITTTGYDPTWKKWSDHNRYGYDRENATLYIQTINDTRLDLHSGITVIVWKVQVGDQIFYTTDPNDRFESVFDNKTGQTIYMNYVMSLNGTKVYFNWNDKPANWLEEIHIQVPGTNYTRLVPFNWKPVQIFDKVYVFNVTIPEIPWNLGHTDVYYEDGSEVPVGTNLKVFGTNAGPGIYHNYFWDPNGWWTQTGSYIPGIQAPWNNSTWMNYFTTLNGTRVYNSWMFGWVSDHWGASKAWRFINDDPVAGNRTARAVEGGYRIYLNDTLKLDVTTPNPIGGYPNQFLSMTNGTYFAVHWRDDIHMYWTTLGNSTYYFRNVMTYYNFTDMGTAYDIIDPFQWDIYQILTPSYYNAPRVSQDPATWIWMNATSDTLQQDMLGYYLTNASDLSRLNVGLVNNWWNLSDAIRGKVFTNQLSDYYPRYNVTIDGKEYFVIDPSPFTSRFDGEWQFENSPYRYPQSMNMNLGGTIYTIALFEQSGFWRNDIRHRRIETIMLNSTSYELEDQSQWKPSYKVTINSQSVNIQLENMNIYKAHTVWGEVFRWMLTDLNIFTQRTINDIIVGTPKWGMWGIRSFDVVEDSGAIDLDGDFTTTDDQYFVRRIHGGSDIRNITVDRMCVEIIWDPNSSLIEDEIHIGAWMGKMHVSWTSEWNETYIWYYASNMSVISDDLMQKIRSAVVDNATQRPNPGYWDIAHMVKNATWADMLARAKSEGWNWINDKTNEWEWIWFGTQQDYFTSWATQNGTQSAGIGLRYEFAGLSLFNGTDQTHFFMPNSIGNVTFVTPGEMFGVTNATGDMIVPLNAKIKFGVAYDQVNGTLFPYSEQRSMWGWWDRPIFGADFNSPNLMNMPTPSSIDKVSFTINFGANITSNADSSNEASMKIDQQVGNWDVAPYVNDGRQQNASGVIVPLMGKDVFLNRSLSINYYVTAFTGMAWDVMDDKGSAVDNTNSTESSRFDIASRLANVSFAQVRLGSTYDWSKPVTNTDIIRTLNVTSKTSPIGMFKASYQSESGKSSAGFDISASMYFLTVGFQKWDGYAIYNDPEVLFLLSKGILPPPSEAFGGGPQTWMFIVLAAVIGTAAVVLVVFRKRVKSGLSKLKTSIKSIRHREPKTNVPSQPLIDKFR